MERYFIKSLLNLPENSLLKKATTQLKREGDKVSKILPSGTKVEYIRGENFSAKGFGQKYHLYKEVTKPDNTRYVTNANVIRDDVYINEVYYIEPNYKCYPNYMQWADKVYDMMPGYRKHAEFKPFRGGGTTHRPRALQELLLKKLPPKGEQNYSYQRADYFKQAYTNANTKTTGSTGSAGKMTKKDFVSYMNEKLSKRDSVSTKALKDAEVRNLAKLFGISVDEVLNLNKTTYRKLVMKFHPDKSKDELSNEIFTIINKLKVE